MKATVWLVLELEEVRRYSNSSYKLKVTKVRQTQPLGELAVRVTLDVPEEILFPKVEALVAYQSQIELLLPEEEDDAVTS